MYENGRQVNRYANKCRHKKKQKQQAMLRCHWHEDPVTTYNEWFNYYADMWQVSPHYWEVFYLSGVRKYSRKMTSKKIRCIYKEMLLHDDPYAINGGLYKKTFDYEWEVDWP